jgi:hypothetical protein
VRPVRHIHASGFHGASREQWATLADEIARRATVAGLTECRRDVAPFNWNLYRPKNVPGAECAVMWDRAVWGQVMPASDHRGHWRITAITFYTGNGHERPGVVATWVLLRQEGTGKTLLVIVAHMPASVQRGDGFSRNLRRVRAWRSALSGLHRMVLHLRSEHRPDEVILSADWNVDVSRRVWKVLINAGLGNTGLRIKRADEGTHHARTIDAHATTMRAPARHVLNGVRGFDHRPVLVRLNSKEPS